MTIEGGGVTWRLEGGVLVVCSGSRFTTPELQAAFRDAVLSDGFAGPMPLLFDNRESAESASADEIMSRAERIAASPKLFGPRIAIVVSDIFHYGLARMGATFAETDAVQVRVFVDMHEAMTWVRG